MADDLNGLSTNQLLVEVIKRLEAVLAALEKKK